MAINILIAGDYCPHNRVLPLLGNGEVLKGVHQVIQEADFSIVNLECPIVEKGYIPLIKERPNLGCDEKAICDLVHAGFKMVTLANNHVLDYGRDGVARTIKECNMRGLTTIGAGLNREEASRVHYQNINGKRFAFINCCEHEYSVSTERDAGANPLNPIRQHYEIKEAKCLADYVIVIIHGGVEGYQLPTPRMKEAYRFFVDTGADAVINHHQHCFSGYEIYEGKPIFYGLGNFCFDWAGQRGGIWNEGYMVKLNFNDAIVSFDMVPYIQCDQEPSVEIMDESRSELFYEKINQLNAVISDDPMLQREFKQLVDRTSTNYQLAFEPYYGRIASGLYARKLLPSTLSRKRILKLLDYIGCESHRERVIQLLTNKYYQLS